MGEEEEDSPLALAVKEDNLKEVLRLLKAGEDPNAQDDLGETPLFEAASAGAVDVTAALLAHSADPGFKSPSGMVARELAMETSIKTLLDLFEGKEVEADAERAALDAVGDGVRTEVEAQLAKRKGKQAPAADLDAKAPPPVPPKEPAAEEAGTGGGGPQTFSMADDDEDEQLSPLLKAVQLSNLDDTLRLLKEGSDPNIGDALGETPLFEAAVGGDASVAAALLLHKADPTWRSTDGMTPMQLAESAPIKALLNLFSGVQVASADKLAALEALSPTIRQSVEEHLAEKEAPPQEGSKDAAPAAPSPADEPKKPEVEQPAASEQEDPPLLKACQNMDQKEVFRLLEGGADPNLGDATGETPLFEASAGGDFDIAAALLLHKADPGWRSSADMTPMVLAEADAMKALLELFSGGDVSSSTKETALEALSQPLRQKVEEHLASKHPPEDAEAGAAGEKEAGTAAADEPAESKDVPAAAPAQDEPPKQEEDKAPADPSPADEPKKPEAEQPAAAKEEAPAAEAEDPPLLLAVQGGDVAEVLRLLEGRADPNLGDAMGETPLFEAIAGGDTNVAAALLLHSADLNHRSSSDMTPLQFVEDDAMKAVLALFSSEEKSSTEASGLEALNPSMRQKVEQMLAARHAVQAPEAAEASPEPAAPAGEGEATTLEDGDAAAEPSPPQDEPEKQEGEQQHDSKEQDSPLLVAVQSGVLKDVMRLLEGRADPNLGDAMGETPLFEAAAAGDANVAAALLVHSADPGHRSTADITPVQLAADDDMKALLELFSGSEAKSSVRAAALEALSPEMRKKVEDHLAAKHPQEEPAAAAPADGDAASPAPAAEDQEASKEAAGEAPSPEADPKEGSDGAKGDAEQAPAAAAPAAAEEPPKPEAGQSAEPQQEQDSPLLVAVQNADVAEVLRLLEGRADPNLGDATGETPLFEAAVGGDANVAAALLLHSADPSHRSADMTPVQLAADDAMKALLQLFSDGKAEDSAKALALEALNQQLRQRVEEHLAAKHPAEKPASEEPKADAPEPAEPEKPQESAAQPPAAEEDAKAAAAAAPEAPEEPPEPETEQGTDPKQEASAATPGTEEEPPKPEVEQSTDPQQEQDSPLLVAVQNADVPEVSRLLEGRADPNLGDEMGETPLFEAAAGGDANMAAALLLNSADPSHRSTADMTPVQLAADDAMKALLQLFSNNDSDEATRVLVLEALSEEWRKKVEEHLASKHPAEKAGGEEPPAAAPEPAEPEPAEQPAAAAEGAEDAATADKTPADEPGKPPQEAASAPSPVEAAPNKEAAEEAAASGGEAAPEQEAAKDPASQEEQDPPLLTAVQNSDLQEVLRLLEGRADPNLGDAMGETPLFEAVAGGDANVAAALLLSSADPGHRSSADQTPVHMAADDAMKALLGLFTGDRPEAPARSGALEALSEPMRERVEQHFAAGDPAPEASEAVESPAPNSEQTEASATAAEEKADLTEEKSAAAPSPAETSPPEQETAAASPGPEEEEASKPKAEKDSPLLVAVMQADLQEVLRLLEGRADPNLGDATGETPLFEAAAAGDANIAAALLLHSGDPGHRSTAEMTPMQLAADSGMKALLGLFSSNEVESSARASALEALSSTMREKVEEALASRHPKEKDAEAAPASPAGQDSPPEAAEAAAEVQEAPSPPEEPEAAAPGPAEESPAPQAAEPAAGAAEEASSPAEEQQGPGEEAPKAEAAAPGAEEESPLLDAVQRASLADVLRLLEGRANPNLGDAMGETPLFEAAAAGDANVAAALLLHSADPGWRSTSDMTPAQMAADDTIKALLKLFGGGEVEPSAKTAALEALDASLREKVEGHLASKQPAQKEPESADEKPAVDAEAPSTTAQEDDAAAAKDEAAAGEEGSKPEASDVQEEAAAASEEKTTGGEAPKPEANDSQEEAAAAGEEKTTEGEAPKPEAKDSQEEAAAASEEKTTEGEAPKPEAKDSQEDVAAAAVGQEEEPRKPEAQESAEEPVAAAPIAAEEAPAPVAVEAEAPKESAPADTGAADEAAAAAPAEEAPAATPEVGEEPPAAAAKEAKEEPPAAPPAGAAEAAEAPPAAAEGEAKEPPAAAPAAAQEPAQPAAQEEVEDSPLLLAVQSANAQDVLKLLDGKADPNVGDAMGETPLFEAAAAGSADVAAVLLLHSADPTWRSSSGMQPDQLASNDAIKALLALFTDSPPDQAGKAMALEALTPPIRRKVMKVLTTRRVAKERAAAVPKAQAAVEEKAPAPAPAAPAAPEPPAPAAAAPPAGVEEKREAPAEAAPGAAAPAEAKDAEAAAAAPAEAAPPASAEPALAEPAPAEPAPSEPAAAEPAAAPEAAAEEAAPPAEPAAPEPAAPEPAAAAEEAAAPAPAEPDAPAADLAEPAAEAAAPAEPAGPAEGSVAEEAAAPAEPAGPAEGSAAEEAAAPAPAEPAAPASDASPEEAAAPAPAEPASPASDAAAEEAPALQGLGREAFAGDFGQIGAGLTALPQGAAPAPAEPAAAAEEAAAEEAAAEEAAAPAPAEPAAPAAAEEEAAPSANGPAASQDPPLSVAVQNQDMEEVLRLLKEGHDPNLGDPTGETPLFEVAIGGNMELAAELLLHGADPEQRSPAGVRPAELAADGAMKALLALFGTSEPESSGKASALEALSPSVRERVEQHLAAKRPATEEPAKDPEPVEKVEPAGDSAKESATETQPVEKETPGTKSTEDPPLTVAVQNQDINEVARLLKEGQDPNLCDQTGDMPLFEATTNGNHSIVAELLLHRADPEKRSASGMNAMDFADGEAIQALLQVFSAKKAEATVKALALEALPGSIRERVEKHISTGVDVPKAGDEAPPDASQGPLEEEATVLSAAQQGNMEDMVRLLKKGCDPNLGDDLGETALFEVVAADSLAMAAELMLHGADPERRSTSGGTPADLTSNEAMKVLLQLFSKASVGASARSAALEALEAPLRKRVEEHLAAQQPAPEAKGTAAPEPAAAAAAKAGEAEAATAPAAAAEAGEAELIQAVQSNDRAWAKRLLQDRADVNVADAMGETALFEAASGDNLEMAAMLLLAKADANHVSRGQVRAEELAATTSMKTLLELFRGSKVPAGERSALAEELSSQTWSSILAKLEVNGEEPKAPSGAEESDEGPPLMVAARQGDLKEVQRLLAMGEDPNKGDAVGETPLFEAVFADDVDIAASLLLKKADPGQRSFSDAEAANFADGDEMKILLNLFKGKEVEEEDEELALEALNTKVRAQVREHFRDTGKKRAERTAPKKDGERGDTGRRAAQTKHEDRRTKGARMMNGNEEVPPKESEASEANLSELALAVRRDDVAKVMALLESGSDVNVTNANGETPLFDAMKRSNADIVAALLMHNADPCIVSHRGHVARKWANSSMDKMLDFFQGVNEHAGITDLSCLSGLSQKMRQTAIRHVQDRSARETMLHLDVDEASAPSSPQPRGSASTLAIAAGTPREDPVVSPLRGSSASAHGLVRGPSGLSAGSPLARPPSTRSAAAEPRFGDDVGERLAELEQLYRCERAARQASDRKVAALEARLVALEALLLQPPRSLLAPGQGPPAHGPAPAAASAAAPGCAVPPAAPAASSAAQRYEVLHGPFVATRKAPSMRSDMACRLPRGTIVTLAEWNASREWRRIVEAPGGFSESVDSWVLVQHSIWGPLLRPLDVPLAPAFLEKLADWRSVVQAACCDADEGAWGRGEAPSKELDMQEARRFLGALGRGAPPEAAGRSAGADALLGIFRGEPVAEDAERRKALASLEPDTVRIVLSAALQHLQDSGACVQVRHIAPTAAAVAAEQ